MIISKYYYIFPLLLTIATYVLLFKEQKLRKEKQESKEYTWLVYIGVILGVLLAFMGISYMFFTEHFTEILKSILLLLHIIWFLGIILWYRKLTDSII